MNPNKLKILFFTLFSFFTVWVSLSWGAVQHNFEVAKTPNFKPQEILYRLDTNDLETLKNSLVRINLHMREGAGKPRPNIKIVIHGKGAKFFYKEGMDSELKYMLDWFNVENVQFGICKSCQKIFGIDMKALPEGFFTANN